MHVYLIAAPEDEAAGEEFAAYLKRFGVFVRTEYGAMAYPPARTGEITLALWSRNAMMSSRQILLTNRAIDAWSEGRLVMARLDHGLSPRGLSDLYMFDLTMPSMREHRYHEVLNGLRAMEDARRRDRVEKADLSRGAAPGAPASPFDSDELAGEADLGIGASQPEEPQANLADPGDTPVREARKSQRSRALLPLLGLLVLVLGLVSVAMWSPPQILINSDYEMARTLSPIIYIVPVVLVLLVFGGVVLLSRRSKGRVAKRIAAPAEAQPAPAPQSIASPAPEPEPEHDVFVSYSHQNAQTVLPIVETVEQQGVSIWIDREEMRAGQTWAGQIVRAIKSSSRLCLMCSEASFASDHVRREVYLADKYGKRILPVRLDQAVAPEDIEYFLVAEQWIDLSALPEDEHASAIHNAIIGTAS